ncbi:MAG: PQQ-binding-like beta-propeller repeat protein [Hyphomonadaceae bacterium]
MMKPARIALLLAVCAAVASCSMFGGKKKEISEEEKAARISLSVVDQKIEPDPALAATTVTLPPSVPATDWLQTGGNASNLTPPVVAGSDFKVAWRASIGSGTDRHKRILAPPVAKDGRIFVIDSNQRVTAVDASSGRKEWSVEMSSGNKRDEFAVGAGLAIAGDKLLVASGYGYLTALSLTDGSEIWKHITDNSLTGAPAVLGNRAFVTTANNELYAFSTDDGEVLWTDQAIAETARILSAPSPAVSEDVLVAPYSSGELIAYLPANGRRLWQDTLTTIGRFTPLSAINDIAGRPVLENNIVYAASYSGVLAAIDVRSGTRMWNMLFGARLGPVIGGDFLFIVGTEGQVLCLNKLDGKVVWSQQLTAFRNAKKKQSRVVWTGPLIADGRLVFASSEGQVLALSIQNGETLASLNVKQPVYIEPIAAAGLILLLTDEGDLVAIR